LFPAGFLPVRTRLEKTAGAAIMPGPTMDATTEHSRGLHRVNLRCNTSPILSLPAGLFYFPMRLSANCSNQALPPHRSTLSGIRCKWVILPSAAIAAIFPIRWLAVAVFPAIQTLFLPPPSGGDPALVGQNR